jgi:pilus assembly protein Flp/PilA
MKFINKLIRDEAGATAIEYGLIAALIAVAAITAMNGWATSSKHVQHDLVADVDGQRCCCLTSPIHEAGILGCSDCVQPIAV